jgi:hypothetical protein
MDVDENYDDSGDEKRSATKQESRRGSPKAMNGGPAAPSSGTVEQQA